MNLEGLIPIAAGVVSWLYATGVLPKNPQHPEQWVQWRAKAGGILKVLCPLLVIFGVLQLVGVVR